MHRTWLLIALIACGHASAPALPTQQQQHVRRLLPPAPIDPGARGAAYLTAIAMQLQPAWGQFLDDCRLWLPVSHPLNHMALAATVELVIDRKGQIADIRLATSGNRDFDRAVEGAIADAGQLGPPPVDLLSDDDRMHVRWLFARDRRQAGPATAEILRIELPLREVTTRLLAGRELARAAQRIAIAPESAERAAATEQLMTQTLREAIASADSAARRAAVDAIGRGRVLALAADVRALLEVTSDTELRLVAAATAAALADRDAAAVLLSELPGDLAEHPRLVLAETRALVALGRAADAAAVLRVALDKTPPNPNALQALAVAPVPELAGKLVGWLEHGDARTRAAVCTALAGGLGPPTRAGSASAWPAITRGMRDPDAMVRAACADAAAAQTSSPSAPGRAPAIARLRQLARDRDRGVRAHALSAIVALDPSHLVSAAADPASEVRAAFATALASALPSEADADLRELIDDRDPDVRAAAWASLAAAPVAPADRAQRAAHAAGDAAAQVRRAAIPAIDDDELLVHLAASDDSPEVRTEALVALAGRRGRVAASSLLLDRLAASPAGSPERVRIALAWLLAR